MSGRGSIESLPRARMSPLSEQIWKSKYKCSRGCPAPDASITDTWQRVARAVAGAETNSRRWAEAYLSVLSGFVFLPGGRVLAGAGVDSQVTLFNCFVSGTIPDSIESMLEALKETAITMQQGGGVGCDFSELRPSGSPAIRTGSVASGPLSFMTLWDSLCQALLSTSTRRGAMMGTLRCDHPDIFAFIDAKRDTDVLTHFNLSVLVTDAFMQAIAENEEWPLTYPALATKSELPFVEHVSAISLWQRIVSAAHETAEPGLLFIDRINRENNLGYCEKISATNPCGEIPLPPYGACDLGSINLATLVREPFASNSEFDRRRLVEVTKIAVRFLDDVIDISGFPLGRQEEHAKKTRRIGLGITGLADTLAMLGINYDSDQALDFATRTMEQIRDAAYETSVELAIEKGAFPLFDRGAYLQAPFIQRLPAKLRDKIAASGIRNSHLLAIAPTGTISLLAGNVSSGIEPIYALQATRLIRGQDLKLHELDVFDYAYNQWLSNDRSDTELPGVFVTAEKVSAKAHLAMQARLQPYIDNAISKTVNLPADATVRDVDEIYSLAYSLGLKGCTVFRQGSRHDQVIRSRDQSHCCHVDREAD